MEALKEFSAQTFSSLKVPNYRLYFIGQGLSQVGSWMQIVALGWLVLTLTDSGTQLGIILAFRFFPQLVGGPFGGIPADRYSKRTILLVTQSASALVAFAIGTLVFTNVITMWMLYAFALILGVINLFDHPTRQVFVHEMVGPENLRNAVTLNSTVANLARAVGPMIAGSVIVSIGIAACYFANALSFIAVIAMLLFMDEKEMHKKERKEKPRGHLLESVSYAASVPVIKTVLIAMAVIGTLAYEFQVSLPLLAAMGAGSVAGGLFAASRVKVAPHEFVASAFFFGLSIVVTAIMPTLSLAIVGVVFVGFFSINLTSLGNTMIQLAAAPHMRGQVMSLWSMAIFGSTLVGAPFVGLIGEYIGPRWGLAVGGVAAMAAAVYAARTLLQKIGR